MNSLFFLLCSGIWYLVSNLARVLTILVIKLWSLFVFTVSVFACLLSLDVGDIRAGIFLEGKAGSNPELENAEDTGVEALIDASLQAVLEHTCPI